jgi:hypothetical protein
VGAARIGPEVCAGFTPSAHPLFTRSSWTARTLAFMFALTATVRPIDSPRALALLRDRLDRFEHLPVRSRGTMVVIQGVGRVLVREQHRAMRLDAVAAFEDQIDAIRGVITKEVAEACHLPDGGSLTLTWERPETVPVELR